jgi:hypothetical protein
VIGICEESNVDFEEIVKIHTDHEEGSWSYASETW